MRLEAGKQYKIKWLDAFSDARWTTELELTELLENHSEPVEQTVYFIRQTEDFYVFSSGKPSKKKDVGYFDICAIPRGWVKEIKAVR